MTIPVYAGVVTSTGVGTTTSPDISAIASGSPPTVGDLIFVQVDRASQSNSFDQHFDGPVGYHRHGAVLFSGTFVSAIFWKIRESGDSDAPTFSWAVSDAFICSVHCIRGADQARPICRATAKTTASSTTLTWQPDTTPVADCLVLASAAISGNRANSSPAAGWTERVDTQQAGGSKITAYAMTQGLATSGSTTIGSVTFGSGSGTSFLASRLFFFQPPQTATPKDVRSATGTLISPTATGIQNITGLGFDCKALIVYGAAVNSGSTSNNAWSQGVGADDGVTTAAQRCVGYNVFQNAGGQGCKWVRNSSIVCMLLPGNQSSPDLQAAFSRIADGFSLNWTTVQATGYAFNYIALGGADFRAAVDAVLRNTVGGVTGLPWRPSFVHAISAFGSADADSVTNGVTTTDNSYGWLDCNTGAQWCFAINGSTKTELRDNSFCTLINTEESWHLKTTSDGFQWNGGSASVYMFYLACSVVGGDTYFPFQVELQRADSSGTTNAVQTVPNFAVGQSTTTKKLVYQSMGLASTNPPSGSQSGGMGHASFDGAAAIDADALWNSHASAVSQSRGRENVASFVAPGKYGYWNDPNTIVWSTNDTTGRIIGLFTLGFIGQAYEVTAIGDTAAATDSVAIVTVRGRLTTDNVVATELLARVVNCSRALADSVAITDSLARTVTRGRVATDTVAVTDSLARTVTRGRVVTDTVVVTDSLKRTVTRGRTVSDTVAVTDSLKRTATYGRLVTFPSVRDSVSTGVDSLKRTATYGRAINDVFSIADSLVCAVSSARVISDSVAVADSLTCTVTRGRVVTDAVSAVDAVLAEQSTAVALSESISVIDQVSPLLATSANDSIAVADQLATQLTSALAPIVDATSVSDSLGIEVAVTTNDSVTIVDAHNVSITAARVASDALAMADALVLNAERSLVVSDSVAVTEAQRIQIDRLVAVVDSLAVADSQVVAIEAVRVVVDGVVVTDAAHASTEHSVADSLSVADDVVAELIEGSTFVSSSDDVAVEDAISTSRESTYTLNDVASVADASTATLAALRALTDAVTVADQAAAVGAPYARALADAVAVGDDVTLKASFAPTLADSISVVDQVSAFATIVATDVVATADLLTVGVTYVIAALADVVALDDATAVSLDRTITAHDDVVVLDMLARGVSIALALSDIVSATDAAQADIAGAFQRTVSDDVDVVDEFATLSSFVRPTVDTIAVSDTVQVGRAESVTTADAVAMTDASVVELAFAQIVPDAVAVADTISRVYDAVRTLSDAVAVTDVLAQGSVKLVDTVDTLNALDAALLALAYERKSVDTESVTDNVLRAHSAARTAIDSVAILDSLQTSLAKEIATADAVTVIDAFALAVAYDETIGDVAAVADLVSVAVDKGASVTLNDGASALDSATLALAYARASADAVVTTDDLAIEQIGYEVEASDAVSLADTIGLSVAVGKSLSDVVATPDALSAQRTLGASEGGSSSDVVDAVDMLFVDRPKLATDQASTADSLGIMVWSMRTAIDAVDVEDSAFQGELVFIAYGVDDANVGPIIMSTIENGGPLSISGGPDLSSGPGPAVFVTRLGDLVDVTDRMIQGASLAIEFTDSVEATG